MSDKNYQELYLKARKIYETATVAYTELVSYTDVLEKDQLKAATVAIEKAKKTCLMLQQKAKNSKTTATLKNPQITIFENTARYLLQIFKIKYSDLGKLKQTVTTVTAQLNDSKKVFTELELSGLRESLKKLDANQLKVIGSSHQKLPKNTTITKPIFKRWGTSKTIIQDLLHVIEPVLAKLKKAVNDIQENITKLPGTPGGEDLIAALHGIVDTKGGGHVFTDTFLKKTTGDKAAAEDYIKDMCAKLDISQRIKLSRKIENFAAIIYQKSVCYIKARKKAKEIKGDALKLLEQFFATAGIENMAEWTKNKNSGKYVKIMLLRDALVGSVIGPIEKKITALAGGDDLLTSLNNTISNLGKEPILSIDFLDDINGNEFLAKKYVAKKYKNADLPKEIKLLEEYAKNILAKSALYTQTIDLAKKMGKNALELSEQFFTATIGVKNMAEYKDGKESPVYKRILILKQALIDAK